MRLWIITNIHATPAKGYGPSCPDRHRIHASGIQNFMTAIALARKGIDVCLWVASWNHESRGFLQNLFGVLIPDNLKILPFRPRGKKQEKKTPFYGTGHTGWNLLRGIVHAGMPDAVLSRSPLVLRQLDEVMFFPGNIRRVLELQYPEYALLWRGWRKKNPNADLASCTQALRQFKEQDRYRMASVDGVLYAAKGHLPLLRRFGLMAPQAFLPSGCLPHDHAPIRRQPRYDIGFVGTLAMENGLETLLDALALLPERRLLIVGGGSDRCTGQLQKKIAELGLGNRVELTGKIPFARTREHMVHCAVGAVPILASQGPEKRQWASPLKLFEWMASGTPLVASAVPSIRQHVTDGKEALLTPPGDARALAQALERLLQDPIQGREIADSALRTVADYTFERRAERILTFIRSLPA